jgi:hypothetical protein
LNYAPTNFGGTKLKRNYSWGYANNKGSISLIYGNLYYINI